MTWYISWKWNGIEKKIPFVVPSQKSRRRRRRTDDLPVFVLCRKSSGARCIVYLAHSRNEHRTNSFSRLNRLVCIELVNSYCSHNRKRMNSSVFFFVSRKNRLSFGTCSFFCCLSRSFILPTRHLNNSPFEKEKELNVVYFKNSHPHILTQYLFVDGTHEPKAWHLCGQTLNWIELQHMI